MMKTTTNDPIVAEVRATRAKHAAQFGYDVKKIFENIRAQQEASGRTYVRYPANPSVGAATRSSSK
jgi:hypothetical protein